MNNNNFLDTKGGCCTQAWLYLVVTHFKEHFLKVQFKNKLTMSVLQLCFLKIVQYTF
jgi:hypothetical protein